MKNPTIAQLEAQIAQLEALKVKFEAGLAECEPLVGTQIEIAGSTGKYKVLKVWPGYEQGSSHYPVIKAEVQRIKSERPRVEIIKFLYE